MNKENEWWEASQEEPRETPSYRMVQAVRQTQPGRTQSQNPQATIHGRTTQHNRYIRHYSIDHSDAMTNCRRRETPLGALAPAVSTNVVQLRGVGATIGVASAEHYPRIVANSSHSVIESRTSRRCHRLPTGRAGPDVKRRTPGLLDVITLHGEHCTPSGDRSSATAHRFR